MHRFRPGGILLVLLIPASLLLLPQYSLAPLFQIRASLFALLGFSAFWALIRRAKLKATRHLPKHATAQQELRYRVDLENTGALSLTGSSVLEIPPDNRPSFDLFAHSREPGEQKRNLFDRFFCYYRWEWLQRTLTRFRSESSPPLQTLAPGAHTSTTLTLTPKQRGVISLNDLRVTLPDPLGLFQQVRKIHTNNDQLIVLPKRYRLPQFSLPGSARFQIGGETASSAVGQSGDFTSVRDYRPGDPLRHIHWKSWAKTGHPIVKEYEEVFFPRYGLVLDTFVPAEDADIFEESVSVAASFAATIDTRESLLDLMFIRDEAHVFSAGRGEERIDKMLEVLAGVSCEPREDFIELQKLILRYREDLTACICIFTGWSEARNTMLKRLLQASISLKVICICKDEESIRQAKQSSPPVTPVHWLRSQHIQQDLISPAT